MRAIHATAFGAPEVLRTVQLPEPEPDVGELLLDVVAAGVLFLDTQLRAGWGRGYFAVAPPYVPGTVVSGTVAAVGTGVSSSWVGRRVVGSTSGPGEYRGGGYAERATVPVAGAHLVPEAVDLIHALAAHDGLMAVSLLDRARLGPGDSALVTAASGSIGVWLVPMLKEAGIRTLAAARGPEKTGLAADRGADLTLDYADDNWASAVSQPVDAVFDGTGGEGGRTAFDLLRRGGQFFSYGAAAGDFADVTETAGARGVEVIGIHDGLTAEQAHGAMEKALWLLAQHRLEPVIGVRLPLHRAHEAHAAIEARRVLGKTVLTP